MTEKTPLSGDEEEKSKTQLKKEMHELQALGTRLLELPDAVYQRIEIPGQLEQAISEARRIKSRSALRRQMQLIGKIMRRIDTDDIRAAIHDFDAGGRRQARQHQLLEQCRDALIANEPGAMEHWIENHPQGDTQQLRQLVRLAGKEQHHDSGKKYYRRLFQFLKEEQEQERL